MAKKQNNLSSVLYASIFWPPHMMGVYNTTIYVILYTRQMCTSIYNISVKTTTIKLLLMCVGI